VFRFDINSKEVVQLTAKLERLNATIMPKVVASTLNELAFDVKQKELSKSANKNFINRKPKFFDVFSKVDKARGNTLSSLRAEVGMKSNGNKAVEELKEQEHGGVIKSRSFIPTEQARVGASIKGLIRSNARLKKIKFANVKDAKGVSEEQKFAKTVAHVGKGGLVLAEKDGKQTLWRVNSLNRSADGKFKLTPLYTYEKGRSAKIKSTKFFLEATNATYPKALKFYTQQAEREYSKLFR
jgi:hypothetical protein